MKTVTEKGHGLGWKKQRPDYRDFRYEHRIRVAPETLPASVDLSNLVSTVKDQGQLGACVAHGTTSGFEACQIKLAGSATLGCRLLVYRDGRIIGGDYPGDNGCNIRDGIQATVQDGVAPETDWPYNISQFDNTPPAKAVVRCSERRDDEISSTRQYKRIQPNTRKHQDVPSDHRTSSSLRFLCL